MIFSPKPRDTPPELNILITNINIQRVYECNLGLVIDDKLSWKPHINYILPKVANSLGIISKAMTTFKKPNLFDLFEMHSIARGTKVDDMEKADTVFSLDTGITPFDTDQIISEFL